MRFKSASVTHRKVETEEKRLEIQTQLSWMNYDFTGQTSPMTKLLRKHVVLNLAFVLAASRKMGDRCHLVVYSGNDLKMTKKEQKEAKNKT